MFVKKWPKMAISGHHEYKHVPRFTISFHRNKCIYIVLVRYEKSFTGPIDGCPNETPHSRRNCRTCKAADMRRRRGEGKDLWKYDEKGKARSYLNVYMKRGKIVQGVCEVCGDPNTQAHHDDYSKPLDVRWLCIVHHREHHKEHDARPAASPDS